MIANVKGARDRRAPTDHIHLYVLASTSSASATAPGRKRNGV